MEERRPRPSGPKALLRAAARPQRLARLPTPPTLIAVLLMIRRATYSSSKHTLEVSCAEIRRTIPSHIDLPVGPASPPKPAGG
jgi:hypothetical protein